jgi:GNAT superfamily N-acetyltransferase
MTFIRQYEPSDYDVCRHRLWVQLAQRHRDIYNAPEIGGDDPGAGFDKHLALVGPDQLWVAELDTEVVGLIGLILTEDSSEIEPVIVDDRCRGHGVGSALVEHVKQVAIERDLPVLMVRPVGRSSRMLEFMSKHGFDTIGNVEPILRGTAGPTRWIDDAEVSGVRFNV